MRPSTAAAQLVAAHRDDPAWLDQFAEALDERRGSLGLARTMRVWGSSRSEFATRLGVTRQALSKWLHDGVPTGRAVEVADLAAATDLLVHHLKVDRIPAVVRRPAGMLGDRSLLDVLQQDGAAAVLTATRAMFSFADAHA